MIHFKEAQKILIEAIKPVQETERVAARDALNRVVASDHATSFDSPDVAKSAVDGYAISSLEKGEYRLAGEIPAGQLDVPVCQPGETLFVMTGAPVPQNARAVVRVEDSNQEGETIVVPSTMDEHENINNVGSESAAGTVFAQKGDQVSSSLYPAMFYAGMNRVEVYSKPKIVILSSGDELLEVEDEYQPGMTYNVNQYIFESLSASLPLDVEVISTLPDDREATGSLFNRLSGNCDLVITSGGISRGKFDFIRDILLEEPYDLLVNKTAIRPGSPLMAARHNDTFFMAMPGYPAAFLTNMVLYLLPVLRRLCGMKQVLPEFVTGVLATPMRSRKGADVFNRAVVKIQDGELLVSDPGTQKTSHFLSFSQCNALVYLDEKTGSLEAGEDVQVVPYGL